MVPALVPWTDQQHRFFNSRIHQQLEQYYQVLLSAGQHLLDNLMADLLPDENNLKYIVGEQHYVIQAVIALREKFLFSGKQNPPLKMNECNFLHHYKWNGGNLYFQFNFLKSQNIYLNFNISQKYPSFLTFFWKVGLGLGCICQKVCQSDPEYIRFACNAKFICSGTRSNNTYM